MAREIRHQFRRAELAEIAEHAGWPFDKLSRRILPKKLSMS